MIPDIELILTFRANSTIAHTFIKILFRNQYFSGTHFAIEPTQFKTKQMKLTTLLLFMCIGIAGAKAQNSNDFLLSADYQFTYSENVTVRVGAAVADKKRSELHSGTDVGNVKIDPKVYEKMEEQAGTSFHFEIKKYGLGALKEITMTNLKNGQMIKGLYDAQSRKFIFATAKGKKQNDNCGSIGLGTITGQFSMDMKSITPGNFGVGFIAGCNPVLVSAGVTFYYTGAQTSEVQVGNYVATSGGLWEAGEDTLLVKSRLENSRWKPVSWAHKGTIVNAKPNDFAGFAANGEYEAALLNIYGKGNWSYNGRYNTIDISISGGKTTYFITEINDSSLHCYSFNDEFTLKKKATPSTSISGSRTTKMLSGKWKINSHKKGVMKLTYKPNDFIRFFEDGSYEHVLFNMYNVGNWKWEETDKKFSVNCGGLSQWEITSISATELKLSRPNEVLILTK